MKRRQFPRGCLCIACMSVYVYVYVYVYVSVSVSVSVSVCLCGDTCLATCLVFDHEFMQALKAAVNI